MQARSFNTKADLLLVLIRMAPSVACERAIRAGRVTVLGGFTPATGLPLVISEVVSRHGRIWYTGVQINERTCTLSPVWYACPEDVPWAAWDGSPAGNRLFIDGETPQHTESLRHAYTATV